MKARDERLRELRQQSSEILKEICKLNDEIWQEMIDTKSYITDLSQYDGLELSSITAIGADGCAIWIPSDEILSVNDGRLYASSYQGGIVEWNESGYYEHRYHRCTEKLDIIGFTEIEVYK